MRMERACNNLKFVDKSVHRCVLSITDRRIGCELDTQLAKYYVKHCNYLILNSISYAAIQNKIPVALRCHPVRSVVGVV